MTSNHFVIRTVLCLSTLTLAIACSSSTTGSDSSGGTSGASGTTGPSGTSIDKCGGTTSTSKCTAAELKPYNECFVTACDSKFGECYGAAWKTGTFTGPCGTYLTCFNACACGDEACYAACPQPSDECTACRVNSSACSDGCKLPACGGATTGSSKACADLAACCAKIESPSFKTNCDQSIETSGTDAELCATFLGVYKTGCP